MDHLLSKEKDQTKQTTFENEENAISCLVLRAPLSFLDDGSLKTE